jgi:hypothetical protein
MVYKYEYVTASEREQIMNENQYLRWVGEDNITEGNFLTFTDDIEPESKPTYEELENQLLLMADSQAGGIL